MQQEQPEAQTRVTDQPWSVRMADSVIQRHPPLSARWHYEYGLMLKSLEHVWRKTGDEQYWRYILKTMNQFVDARGNIRSYRINEYNLDQINPGKLLFPLYHVTGDERYKKAIYHLREQLQGQPRTKEGGFWHKEIYPYQMWLDGIYMASPFYVEFARTFNEPAIFDDAAFQIMTIAKHTRDAKTGLYYHGWDESKQQRWANPETGCSPQFWGRAIGWFAMSLVDVLDHFPQDHPRQNDIVAILQDVIEAVARVQEPRSGLWYQVLDQGERKGNYLEASGSCMFVYAIAKAIRQGHIDGKYMDVARRGYDGVLQHLIQVNALGQVNLEKICVSAGLGGIPYRDGSYEYYIGEKIVPNDLKGVGAFILAAVEMETV